MATVWVIDTSSLIEIARRDTMTRDQRTQALEGLARLAADGRLKAPRECRGGARSVRRYAQPPTLVLAEPPARAHPDGDGIGQDHRRHHGRPSRHQVRRRQGFEALRGTELVPNVSRLCGMNLYLHGIGPGGSDDHDPPIRTDDALRDEPGAHANVVITNPPFGKKSSITIVNDEGDNDRQTLTYNRPDFWTTTSNKQPNFVQHVKSMLTIHGRAAVVLPDNVLFEGGAGETIRRNLLKECDLHTILRLPTGIFYAQGVKANVLFFDRKPGAPEPWTKTVWVYDLRTNKHFTLKTKRLVRADLDEFVECYRPGDRHTRKATWSEEMPDGRWRPYTYDQILARDKVSLDLFWLRDESLEDSDNLPDPHILAQDIADDLRAALAQIEDVLSDLEQRVRGGDVG